MFFLVRKTGSATGKVISFCVLALEIIIEADFKSNQKEDAAGFNPSGNEKEQLIPTTTTFQRGNFRKGVANVIQIGKMSVSNKTANS